MTFYQRFGLAIGLAGIGIVAGGWPWIGYALLLLAFFFLIFDGDAPGKVETKWYGIVAGAVSGPFGTFDQAEKAGYYGAPTDGVIQLFGSSTAIDKVGIVLHPARHPEPIAEYAEDEQGRLYKVSTEPFEPESN